MHFILFLCTLFLTLMMTSTTALKCYFKTEALHSIDEAPQNASDVGKEYECAKEDRYCVMLDGVLTNPVKNMSFALRSCEGDVNRYLKPISDKVGKQLHLDCDNADGKNKTVGPLVWWYTCCKTDDCNNSAFGIHVSLFFTLITPLILLYAAKIIHS